MLGTEPTKYGKQRVWGTIGYGATAFLSGVIVHFYQSDSNNVISTIAPALVIMLVFGIFDIISIKWLQLPKFTNDGESIALKVWDLMSQKSIAIFLIFAMIAGILESFNLYYLFWHLEEVAEETNYMSSIKLIEGCVIGVQCLASEATFMLLSEYFLKKFGYVHCLTLGLSLYGVRFYLISIIPNPWWLIPIEIFGQGCTYALTYTCIVAYASFIAPPGATATVQALVIGMDDGIGFGIGSLLGGHMLTRLGGRMSFKIIACVAAVTGIAHALLRHSERKCVVK